jgi:hypothetical protein
MQVEDCLFSDGFTTALKNLCETSLVLGLETNVTINIHQLCVRPDVSCKLPDPLDSAGQCRSTFAPGCCFTEPAEPVSFDPNVFIRPCRPMH